MKYKRQKTIYRIGDLIKITNGDYRGELGTLHFLNKNSLLALIKPLNENIILKKDKTKKKFKGFITSHISNCMLFDITNNNISKAGFKIVNNEKLRYFKKSGNIIIVNKIKKEIIKTND
jgi:ribosomal protein L24